MHDWHPHFICKRSNLCVSNSPGISWTSFFSTTPLTSCYHRWRDVSPLQLCAVCLCACLRITARCGRDYKAAAVYFNFLVMHKWNFASASDRMTNNTSGPVGRRASLMRHCRCKNSAAHLFTPITNVCRSPSRWCCVRGTGFSASDCSGFLCWRSWSLRWSGWCQYVCVIVWRFLKEDSFVALSNLQMNYYRHYFDFSTDI